MLSDDEQLKIAVGVWLCFADGKAEIRESSQVYQWMSQDLLPESKEPAVKAIGQWMMGFKSNFLATEIKLKNMISQNTRLPILKQQLLDLCHHIKEADGISKMQEEAAIAKLERWINEFK